MTTDRIGSPYRGVYGDEHEQFRDTVRTFVETRVRPCHEQWERAGVVDRALYTDAGAQGLIGFEVPETYGGAGVRDFRFNAVIQEEFGYAGFTSASSCLSLHNDVVLPYFLAGDAEQRARWLPGIGAGELVTAIAMTEPGAGSDLAGIRTRARRDGDHYVLDGAKTFVTSGQNADLVIVVARTGEHPHRGLTLLVVERGMPGFERGRNLDKIGQHGQDTSELSFTEVRVPVANRLGEENQAFGWLMRNLPQERLTIAVNATASAAGALERTLDYVVARRAFGQPIGTFQNSKFLLAELATEVDIARTFVSDCLAAHVADRLTPQRAAKAKWWTTELLTKVVDRCLQLHGGYGYMTEYPIARSYVDARVQTIYGGTTEIMKEIIGRDLLDEGRHRSRGSATP
ncbi:MAG TPA: acyl-CoA dehydrogenase family protein [Pseudonocardia sp.]|nr:acyl-CoA dehydrogenase family protein [Pseudonocardia sp.]